jgi:hypothetical protein
MLEKKQTQQIHQVLYVPLQWFQAFCPGKDGYEA